MDSLGRTIDYLRISVTDRCNERCLYCMPEGYRGWERTPDHLTAEEVLQVVRVAVGLGFSKFRLTGGEPLLRPDIVDIVSGMAAVAGVEAIGLSTNGTRLAARAQPLCDAGLRTVNVNLDALDPDVYRRVTGGEVDAALAGIRAAVATGFEQVKLNCVLMRGVNETDFWPLVLFAADHALPLRFIELMPVTTPEALATQNFMTVDEAVEILQRRDELLPVDARHLGAGPAKYYRLMRTGALVGFIGPLTTPHFCANCNKLRLTADGKLRPCLGDHGELDLRAALRSSCGDDAIRETFRAALRAKPAEHGFHCGYRPCRPMTAIGG